MLRWRRLALPSFLAVFGLIWVAAHALAHDVAATPTPAGHAAGHHGTVESYVAYLPTSLALCLTLAAAIATGAAIGKRWAGRSGRSLWLFGVVPVLGFAVDTLAELARHGWTATAATQLVPVFLIGLLIQIPFALVAVGLAGSVLWLVEQLAFMLREPTRFGPPVAPANLAWAADPGDGRTLLRAGAGRSRAPPRRLEL